MVVVGRSSCFGRIAGLARLAGAVTLFPGCVLSRLHLGMVYHTAGRRQCSTLGRWYRTSYVTTVVSPVKGRSRVWYSRVVRAILTVVNKHRHEEPPRGDKGLYDA